MEMEKSEIFGKIGSLMLKLQESIRTQKNVTITPDEADGFMQASSLLADKMRPPQQTDDFPSVIGGEDEPPVSFPADSPPDVFFVDDSALNFPAIKKFYPTDCFIVCSNLADLAEQLNGVRKDGIFFNQVSPVQFLEGKYVVHIVKILPVESEDEKN